MSSEEDYVERNWEGFTSMVDAVTRCLNETNISCQNPAQGGEDITNYYPEELFPSYPQQRQSEVYAAPSQEYDDKIAFWQWGGSASLNFPEKVCWKDGMALYYHTDKDTSRVVMVPVDLGQSEVYAHSQGDDEPTDEQGQSEVYAHSHGDDGPTDEQATEQQFQWNLGGSSSNDEQVQWLDFGGSSSNNEQVQWLDFGGSSGNY